MENAVVGQISRSSSHFYRVAHRASNSSFRRYTRKGPIKVEELVTGGYSRRMVVGELDIQLPLLALWPLVSEEWALGSQNFLRQQGEKGFGALEKRVCVDIHLFRLLHDFIPFRGG